MRETSNERLALHGTQEARGDEERWREMYHRRGGGELT